MQRNAVKELKEQHEDSLVASSFFHEIFTRPDHITLGGHSQNRHQQQKKKTKTTKRNVTKTQDVISNKVLAGS